MASSLISLSRILALWTYYHAPLSVVYSFEAIELPRLLNDTGLLPAPLPNTAADDLPRIDLSPVKQFNLTLCTSKEWHRFPGHFLVPDGVRVDFVKSEFDGLLPGHFAEGAFEEQASTKNFFFSVWWPRPETRLVPVGQNDLNREEPSHYVSSCVNFRRLFAYCPLKVPITQCDYLLDLDFPQHPTSSLLEPRYATDSQTWERVDCVPFLDARHSSLLTRTLWLPGKTWQSLNEFGDYCLLKNRKRVGEKERQVVRRAKV